MRILTHSNAPFVNTGYSGQVRQLLPRFQALGHEVAVVANFGVSGATLNWNGVPVYGLRSCNWNSKGEPVGFLHVKVFADRLEVEFVDTTPPA